MIQFRPHQQSALDMLTKYSKGIVCAVTGAGKTLIGIGDTIREYKKSEDQTVVVVSPRILLTSQLCSEYTQYINNAHVLHVHSGDSDYYRTTNPKMIREWVKNVEGHKLIFTTYHSLHRLIESDIEIDTVHMDEAHNSIRKDFFPYVEQLSQKSRRFYSYTATPKYSSVYNKPGMNWSQVYGQMITNISGPEMVNGGYIVPPKVCPHSSKTVDECGGSPYERDKYNLIDIITTYEMKKVLVVSKKTKDIIGLTKETDFQFQMDKMGYSVLHISSKFGAFINNQKVNREVFFEELNNLGKDVNAKFVVLHFDIFSEGLNIPCLDGVIFQRNTDYIKILQTVGRAVRLDPRDMKGMLDGRIVPGSTSTYSKQFGLVVTPIFDKSGVNVSNKINNCLDIVFNRGEVCVSTIKK